MPRLTVADLQQMKREGKKIAAAVLYDVTMTRVFERAGVDVISVGDSFMSYLLGGKMEDATVDAMLLFAKGVLRAAERAAVSVDVPIAVCEAGPEAVFKAAQRFKEEAGPDLAKVYVPSGRDLLVEEVRAVVEAGLAAYCRVSYRPEEAAATSPARELDRVLSVATAVQAAGAALIDHYQGTPDSYRELARSLRIPVIGGQWSTSEADGKIFVYPNFLGYRPDAIDSTDRPSLSRLMYELLKPALDEVHAGAWQPS